MTISGFVALYIFMLAGFSGWVIIGRVPAILHTPLMSGANFVHGIVVVGGLFTLLNASSVQQQLSDFLRFYLEQAMWPVVMPSPTVCWRCFKPVKLSLKKPNLVEQN